jgi:hypothetical protein
MDLYMQFPNTDAIDFITVLGDSSLEEMHSFATDAIERIERGQLSKEKAKMYIARIHTMLSMIETHNIFLNFPEQKDNEDNSTGF